MLIVNFPHHLPPGHEQEGNRPAVVIALPTRLGTSRYPMVLLAPITSAQGAWLKAAPQLYPALNKGAANLNRASAVLLDHMRGVDVRRIVKRIGNLSAQDFKPIQQSLAILFNTKV